MKKLKLYLETSVWNFLLAEDAPDKKQITEKFFEHLKRGLHETFISQLVIDEIERTLEEAKRRALMAVVRRHAPKVLPGDPALVECLTNYLTYPFSPIQF